MAMWITFRQKNNINLSLYATALICKYSIMAVAYLFTKKITMSNKELVEDAKQAMKDLSAGNNMIEHEQVAYNCLRLFCERIEYTKEIVDLINQISSVATNNIKGGEKENDGDWYKQTGVLLSNKEALDIAKFVPLYHD